MRGRDRSEGINMARKPTQDEVDQFRRSAVAADINFKNGNLVFAQNAIDAMQQMLDAKGRANGRA
jgi:hypothetical protein